LTRTPLSIPSRQPSTPHKTNQKYPTNDLQTCGMMEIVNKENEDEEMEDHATTTSSTTSYMFFSQICCKVEETMEMETASVLRHQNPGDRNRQSEEMSTGANSPSRRPSDSHQLHTNQTT